jgi:hypothetical protein
MMKSYSQHLSQWVSLTFQVLFKRFREHLPTSRSLELSSLTKIESMKKFVIAIKICKVRHKISMTKWLMPRIKLTWIVMLSMLFRSRISSSQIWYKKKMLKCRSLKKTITFCKIETCLSSTVLRNLKRNTSKNCWKKRVKWVKCELKTCKCSSSATLTPRSSTESSTFYPSITLLPSEAASSTRRKT